MHSPPDAQSDGDRRPVSALLSARALFDWYERAIGFYPLWCVPYRRVRDYEWVARRVFDGLDDKLFVDIAIDGLEQPKGCNDSKEIEDVLIELQGIKTLISHNAFDRETFWQMFSRENFLAVKCRTDPENLFRDLYTKTCRTMQGLDDAAEPHTATEATEASRLRDRAPPCPSAGHHASRGPPVERCSMVGARASKETYAP